MACAGANATVVRSVPFTATLSLVKCECVEMSTRASERITVRIRSAGTAYTVPAGTSGTR